MLSFVSALFLTAALLLTGCGSSSNKKPAVFRSSGNIEELHLFGVPVALNFDSDPRPDGVGAIIYASTQQVAKGIPINSGQLDMLIFDGVFEGPELAKQEPMKVWSFTPKQLEQFAIQRSIGTGYQLPLRWDTRPASNRITVLARYTNSRKQTIYSSSSSILLTVK